MYLILKRGKLREIIFSALQKAGSFRKLEKEVQIPKTSLFVYYIEKRAIKEESLDLLTNYLGMIINKNDIIEELPNNWKQIKGGKKSVEIRKKNGTFEKQLNQIRKMNNQNFKLWHRKMKSKNIREYYLMQYSRFKKIGKYKFVTKNGERVRNKLERDIANLLKSLKVPYKYEPLIKVGNRYFFPDFLVDGKIIIECTEWRGYDKAIKLKEKIKYFKKKYKIYIVIPKALNRYYETLNNYLVLGLENMPNLLQEKSE